MNIKCFLQESPLPSSRSKTSKINEGSELKATPDDQESEQEEEDVLSISDVWCNFDELNKVR